jgi:signal transduction histidine kinase
VTSAPEIPPEDLQAFPRLVSLACHDLRTPLATVTGFAATLTRSGDLGERDQRFVEVMSEAADQMTALLGLLGLAARIAADRYEPPLTEVDTLELASSADERIAVEGRGGLVETDVDAVSRSLEGLAIAAARHGGVPLVTWSVTGREFLLSPLMAEAAPVVTGASPRDLGALVARMAIERLGGSLAAGGDSLRVIL